MKKVVYYGYMKSLSFNKPLVLVMIGLPGSGKSFFARQFSKTFSAPLVSYDRLRHTFYPDNGYDRASQDMIQKAADIQIEELLKTSKTFIVDGVGNAKSQRVALAKQVRSAGYEIFMIWVQTDQDTAKYRSMKRSKRRQDDRYNKPLSDQQYSQLSQGFSPPAKNEPSVVISGKHTYPAQARVVLKRLVAPRATSRTIVNHANRTPDARSPRNSTLIR